MYAKIWAASDDFALRCFKMHEMGIAMQIVEMSIASIPEEMKNVQVERVNLKVGKLAAVIPGSLRFCFDIVAKDTPLSGAKLQIEEVPVIVKCNECNQESIIKELFFRCGACSSGSIEILSGRELDIESIEIADG